MGVTWSMEVLSWAVNNVAWVFYISDVCNCIQGFLIFMLFVWKQKVKRLIYKKYVCGANLSVCTLSRNALEQTKKKVRCGLQLFSARSFLILQHTRFSANLSLFLRRLEFLVSHVLFMLSTFNPLSICQTSQFPLSYSSTHHFYKLCFYFFPKSAINHS